MSAKEIGTYIGNGFDKVKKVILAIFGKTADACDDYDIVVNVTERGKGPNAEPTGSRIYHRKYRINLGDVVLVVLGIVAAIAAAIGIYSLVNRERN